jgi:hypothetical protein
MADSDTNLFLELNLDMTYPVSIRGSWEVFKQGLVGSTNDSDGKVTLRRETGLPPEWETRYFFDEIYTDEEAGSKAGTFSWDGVLGPGLYDFEITMWSATIFGSEGGGNTSISLYDATITVGEVPVPPAVWLLASGLLGLVAFAHRVKGDNNE